MKVYLIRNVTLCSSSGLDQTGGLPMNAGTDVEMIEGPTIEGIYSVCKVKVQLPGFDIYGTKKINCSLT